MMHSSTLAGSMPARRTASRTTIAPRSVAVKPFREPRNLPVGVRTADRITACCISGCYPFRFPRVGGSAVCGMREQAEDRLPLLFGKTRSESFEPQLGLHDAGNR